MRVLFLTVSRINSVNSKGIHTDLMREFAKNGHQIYIVSPIERSFKQSSKLLIENTNHILQVKTLNIQKTNFIEKGIGTLLIEYQFNKAIKKYFSDIKFDLILYSTPPITFSKIIVKLKKRYDAKSYLLLKDIFPQNAIDIQLFKENGIIHNYFRRKEKKLYAISDFIGCMSPANVEYILKHNAEVIKEKIEVCPNSIEIIEKNLRFDKNEIRQKYNIPSESVVFLYGGNLGKPQGIDFIYEILKSNNNKKDRFFVIAGSGTEYRKVKKWFEENNFSNSLLIPVLQKNDYDDLARSCNIGLVFLDKHFTIPNFPSRLLSYLECKMPVLAATDTNTDIGRIAEENNFGFWCENGDLIKFNEWVDFYVKNKSIREQMGKNGYLFLENNYAVTQSYKIIMKHFTNV